MSVPSGVTLTLLPAFDSGEDALWVGGPDEGFGIGVCLDAFALIFVPSSATWPSLTSPAVSHNFRTCRNSAPSAFKCRLRKSLIVGKSGGSSATIITKSFRSRQAFAIRRDEYSPLA